jgi:predicted O-linked N-acetylglucosamine transferase (SPINDLY family)
MDAEEITQQGLKLFRKANQLFSEGHYKAAAESYEQAVRHIPSAPEIIVNLAAAYIHLHRMQEAYALLAGVLHHVPLPQAWLNLGLWHEKQEQRQDAAACYQRALALKPDYVEAAFNLGNVLFDSGDADASLQQACFAYERLPEASAESDEALSDILYRAAHACDWATIDRYMPRFRERLAHHPTAIKPMTVLTLMDDASLQRRNAERWQATKCPAASSAYFPAWTGKRVYANPRIRLGYLSSDFHHHATSLLMAGLFESHDRNLFEVTLYSYGRDDQSPMRQRLLSAVEHVRDIRLLNDSEAAQQIHADQVDILIDLKGHTKQNRMGILAHRPAPCQLHYLGFPNTTGTPYIDGYIGDPVTLPQGMEAHFSEPLYRLPRCYQVNDARRIMPAPCTDRARHGLPQAGVVLGCFNQAYKITPEVFSQWMDLLREIPESVLWLYVADATAQRRLHVASEASGIDRSRVIFAAHFEHDAHLARYGCMDLFLDTFPCTAHTTASEALWMGVPLITRMGESFASRVSASLLTYAGMPHLIAHTPDEYQRMASHLARDTEARLTLKNNLVQHREQLPIFDTQGFTRDWEMLLQNLLA